MTDWSDAVRPGIAVTIDSERTNSQRTVTTDGTCGYEPALAQPFKPDPSKWFDPAVFTPPDNTFGALGDTLRGDGFENVPLAFYKNAAIGSVRMQCRVELFNPFNHPYVVLPVADLTNANAGAVLRAADSRQVQLGLSFTY